MKVSFLVIALPAIILAAFSPANAQASPDLRDPSSGSVSAAKSPQTNVAYERPTPKTRFHNYLFDTFGPYPMVGAAFTAGINQAESTPPEWKQGAEAYGKRLGSNFAIAGVTTTTRYALAQALGDDTIYYRCACKGFLPRFRHAVISSFESRRGEDGHRVFSFPALVAPYAGTMTAAYAWFPSRYNAEDGFRMGNYNLLGYVGGNLAIEFVYGGPHSILSRLHLKKRHSAQQPDDKQ
jgi:hypothetical protein